MNVSGLSLDLWCFIATALETYAHRVRGTPRWGVCFYLCPRPLFFPLCPGILGCEPHILQNG